MKVNLTNRILTAALIAMLMLGLVGVALASDPQPQSVTWYDTVTLYSGAGITSAPTGTANSKYVTFGIQDCYQMVDVTDATTVTGKLQHSPDGSNWADLYTFPAQTADSVVFTRTANYGSYERYVATLATTSPVTISLKCVFKDN
jgi:hypothetical protein